MIGDTGAPELPIRARRTTPDRATANFHYTCPTTLNVAFVSIEVEQVSGHRLAIADNAIFNDFPGVPCTGADTAGTLTLLPASSFLLKNGKATALIDVTLFDPVSGTFTDITSTTQLKIH